MTETKEIRVPSLGDFTDVPVVEIFVSPGETIEEETPLFSLETDKALMEIPSLLKGRVKELKINEGDTVSEGTLVALVEVEAPQSSGDKTASSSDTPVQASEPPTKGGDLLQVRVPDIGDFEEIPVVEIFVSQGDRIAKEDPILSLESDKALMEIPSPVAGEVASMEVKEGDTVSKGTLLLSLIPVREMGESPLHPEPTSPAVQSLSPEDDHLAASSTRKILHASPAVRRLARERGLDLSSLLGTGPKGRITKEDVQKASGKGKVSLSDTLPRSDEGDIQPLTRIKQVTGKHMVASWTRIPHVTHFEKADITELDSFRQMLNNKREEGVPKLSVLPFLLQVVAKVLAQHPPFNATLDEGKQHLLLKKRYHIGVAVDTHEGLVVPVMRDVDTKGVYTIAQGLVSLSKRARERRLTADEMRGSGFTISSLGGIGGVGFTPIINHPEVAILGVSRAAVEPVWNGKEFTPRLLLGFSLSYDHRVIDGAEAARFCVAIKRYLEDIRELLL